MANAPEVGCRERATDYLQQRNISTVVLLTLVFMSCLLCSRRRHTRFSPHMRPSLTTAMRHDKPSPAAHTSWEYGTKSQMAPLPAAYASRVQDALEPQPPPWPPPQPTPLMGAGFPCAWPGSSWCSTWRRRARPQHRPWRSMRARPTRECGRRARGIVAAQEETVEAPSAMAGVGRATVAMEVRAGRAPAHAAVEVAVGARKGAAMAAALLAAAALWPGAPPLRSQTDGKRGSSDHTPEHRQQGRGHFRALAGGGAQGGGTARVEQWVSEKTRITASGCAPMHQRCRATARA